MRGLLSLLLLSASCSLYFPDGGPTAGTLPDSAAAEGDRFRSLANAYIAWFHASNPVAATFDGVHDHDARLGGYSRADMLERAAVTRRYLRELGRLDPALLEDEGYYDFLVLDGHLRARLVELEHVRSWERNPGFYRNVVSGGLYSLSSLTFDTPDRRMSLATQRLAEVPRVLAEAKGNLSEPAPIHTELGIEGFEGVSGFFQAGLPQAFETVKDQDIRRRFDEALKSALEALSEFIKWMREDLAKRSTGSFAIGSRAFAAKLQFEEGVTTPLEKVLEDGYALLRSTQDEVRALAGGKPIREALRESANKGPSGDRLLDEARAGLAELKRWASDLVDIPEDAECRIQETPSFRRAVSFASMQIPGPFETVATDAYYSITLPDPAWPAERTKQHLSFFNENSLPLISVHEAYPGHYTQFLAVQECPSRVRKVFGSASFSEGWAHYCEQLYVETTDASTGLRLQQLAMALLRICRYIVGIELHTKGMTLEKAIEFFEKEGFLERANAEREAKRGTQDPTYLVYTLGKMEILKLREEYLRRTGESLKDFHNEFIRHGYPPVGVVRMILLKERP